MPDPRPRHQRRTRLRLRVVRVRVGWRPRVQEGRRPGVEDRVGRWLGPPKPKPRKLVGRPRVRFPLLAGLVAEPDAGIGDRKISDAGGLERSRPRPFLVQRGRRTSCCPSLHWRTWQGCRVRNALTNEIVCTWLKCDQWDCTREPRDLKSTNEIAANLNHVTFKYPTMSFVKITQLADIDSEIHWCCKIGLRAIIQSFWMPTHMSCRAKVFYSTNSSPKRSL